MLPSFLTLLTLLTLTMATEHPDGNKPTLPTFTDSDHRFFDNFTAYAHENKCGGLIDKMAPSLLDITGTANRILEGKKGLRRILQSFGISLIAWARCCSDGTGL